MDAIQQAHGAAVLTETKMGMGGIFDVKIDGELVFSKWNEHRFPAHDEILAHIAQRLQKA